MPNARRNFSRRAPYVGPRRQSNWLASADVVGFTAMAAAAVRLDQSFSQAQIQAQGPLTITRTVGWIHIFSDQQVATEAPFGALGMMVVREAARVAGIGSLPTPITDEFDDGFFLHIPIISVLQFSSALGFTEGGRTFHFDSRAQRKVTPDDAIVVTVENASVSDGFRYVTKFRMLVKLS